MEQVTRLYDFSDKTEPRGTYQAKRVNFAVLLP
jgi:hypothetical protein